MSELLTASDAASFLGCSLTTTHRLVREGRLVAVRPFGAERRFRRTDLEAFVAGLEPAQSQAGSVVPSAAPAVYSPSMDPRSLGRHAQERRPGAVR